MEDFSGPRNDGWTDSSKYILDVPFWTQNCVILMNNDKWGQISSEDQEAIKAASADYEKYMVDYYKDIFKKERAKLKEIGVEFIKLPEKEKKKFLEIAYDTEWSYLKEEVPDLVEELKTLTNKN